MRIDVTKEDISKGKRCDPDCCPVGRALSRAGVVSLGVTGGTVVVEDSYHHVAFVSLPTEVESWILSFDGYEPVKPISFDLSLPGMWRTERSDHKAGTTRAFR